MPKNCRNFPSRKAEELCKTEAESTQTNKLLSYSPPFSLIPKFPIFPNNKPIIFDIKKPNK